MKAEIARDDKVAIVVGAEGFVGEHVLRFLAAHEAYAQVRVICQANPPVQHKKLEVLLQPIEQVNLRQWKADDLFICYDASFFNTGGKYAIPSSSYRYIPRMVLQAHDQKVGQVMLLSSMRADKDAILSTHRIRALIEETVVSMGFWSTHIFRPSILLGESLPQSWGQGIADQIGDRVNNLTGGWLKKNKPIEAEVVARAMLEVAQKLKSGLHYYSSSWLQDYAIVNENRDLSK